MLRDAGGARGTPPRLALAASPGGHVDLLVALAPAFDGYERTWLLPGGSRLEALRAQGERTSPLRLFGGSATRLVGNLLDAAVGLLRARPQVVVTSGAGVVVPFCLLARALGARILYMETMARVTSASRAGRVLSRVAEATLVQWPETLRVYPDARVCSPPLLTAGGQPTDRRGGTFVALGTHWQPFGRLLAMVQQAAAAGLLPTPVVAQVGASAYDGDLIESVSRISPQRLEELMQSSELVICHGGAGIIATAIRAGHRPLVLARRAELQEHVDDHQAEIVTKLDSLGLVIALGDAITSQAVACGREPVGAGALPLGGEPMVTAVAEALAAI